MVPLPNPSRPRLYVAYSSICRFWIFLLVLAHGRPPPEGPWTRAIPRRPIRADRGHPDAPGRRRHRPHRGRPLPDVHAYQPRRPRGRRGDRHRRDRRGVPSRRSRRLVRHDRRHHVAAGRIPGRTSCPGDLRPGRLLHRRLRRPCRHGPHRRRRTAGHRNLGLGIGNPALHLDRRWRTNRRCRRFTAATPRRPLRPVRVLRPDRCRAPRHLACDGTLRQRLGRLQGHRRLRPRGSVDAAHDRHPPTRRTPVALPLLRDAGHGHSRRIHRPAGWSRRQVRRAGHLEEARGFGSDPLGTIDGTGHRFERGGDRPLHPVVPPRRDR